MRFLIQTILREQTHRNLIFQIIEKWNQWYKDEDGIKPCDINTGECMNFAECVSRDLDDLHIKNEILSDGLFYDSFGDEDQDLLADPMEFGSKPTYDYMKFGLPSHYWIYSNGKHYDSECPNGVYNFFDLPTIKKFRKKYKK